MLLFKNDGVLPIEGFTTFGMSAKPGSTNPIGKFGTGLKNAVAITLRLGGTFRVWLGMDEYVFYTKDEEFRGQTFKRVRMKRRRGLLSRWTYMTLPFTTELGKHWEPWMAFRELEANTRDEENGLTTLVEKGAPLNPFEGTTLIAIDCVEIENAFENIDEVFLPKKKVLFENSSVRVLEGNSSSIFYRGMRVTTLRKPSMFTYEMKNVQLTEDRTSTYTFLDDDRIRDALLECDNPTLVKKVVRQSEGFHEDTLSWDKKKPTVSNAWAPALARTGLSARFSSLRHNLDYGLKASEDVEVSLEVHMWENILEAIQEVDKDIYLSIKEQMVDAGWKDPSEMAEEPPTIERSLDNDIPF